MHRRLGSLALFAFVTACATTSNRDTTLTRQLVGTWAAESIPGVFVTYRADGTVSSHGKIEIDGEEFDYRDAGTWSVKDGAIHNVVAEAPDIPGFDEIELPYVSIEKIVSIDGDEYRYVCPAQGCTNTMRRVK